MNMPPILPEPMTAAAEHAQRARRNLQVLDRLVTIALDLTELVQEQAKAEIETAQQLGKPAPDSTVATDRMIRAVRRTVLLSDKLNDKLIAPVAARPEERSVAARKEIVRGVEDFIGRDAPEGTAEDLRAELHERLDSPDLEDDIETRPVADIITEIRRDLGIGDQMGMGRPWQRRTPKDVAGLCARAAMKRAPAGPFATPTPPRAGPPDPVGCRDP